MYGPRQVQPTEAGIRLPISTQHLAAIQGSARAGFQTEVWQSQEPPRELSSQHLRVSQNRVGPSIWSSLNNIISRIRGGEASRPRNDKPLQGNERPQVPVASPAPPGIDAFLSPTLEKNPSDAIGVHLVASTEGLGDAPLPRQRESSRLGTCRAWIRESKRAR